MLTHFLGVLSLKYVEFRQSEIEIVSLRQFTLRFNLKIKFHCLNQNFVEQKFIKIK